MIRRCIQGLRSSFNLIDPYSYMFMLTQAKENSTFTKEFDGILKMPTAGSIFSSLAKQTSGWNQAQVIWTHKGSISVGFMAPPELNKENENFQAVYNNLIQ